MKAPHGFLRPGLAIGLAVLLSLSGCSNLPEKPSPAGTTASSGTATSATTAGPQSADLLGGLVSSTSATSTSLIIGAVGGIVSAGDFTVVIPPGAITGSATVSVRQPDLSHSTVYLDIAPVSANRFNTPVVLVANAKRMEPSLLSTACISWYNPGTKTWERVPGSAVSLADLTVAAPLWHFSTYRVESGGKAGW